MRGMRVFDHIGIPAQQTRAGELYVAETKVWVTDPAKDAQRIEYLRFEPDSPVTGPVREMPHVAFQTDNLEREIEGAEILLGPFQATPHLRVVFVKKDGAVFEFIENQAGVGAPWFPS
jgi:hypothetical protein